MTSKYPEPKNYTSMAAYFVDTGRKPIEKKIYYENYENYDDLPDLVKE